MASRSKYNNLLLFLYNKYNKEAFILKKEVLITKGLTEEQANYVLELYNTEIKDYVPKADYDLVNSKVETLENTVKERDKQLEGISKNIGDD